MYLSADLARRRRIERRRRSRDRWLAQHADALGCAILMTAAGIFFWGTVALHYIHN